MSNHKMKSLLKGLRYISHIFENEKQPEMQIGNPTDVKHVAHIGWDGGSASANSPTPSWMDGFKSPGRLSSLPLGDFQEDSSSIKSYEDSSQRGGRDKPKLPKSSRNRPSSDGSTKHRKPKKPSEPGNENLPEGSVRSRRKKSKESVNGGSSRSSRRSKRSELGDQNHDSMSETGSYISISNNLEEERTVTTGYA